VFFATTQSLVSADTDGGYDVYDARVPQLGDASQPLPGPCEGDCKEAAGSGPPSVSSSSFSGAGNLVPAVTQVPAALAPKVVNCQKGSVKKANRCVRAKAKKKGLVRRPRGKGHGR